jgi:hypothetical protein
MHRYLQDQRFPDGLLALADPGRGSFDVIRADVPFRGKEPEPCHTKPEGRWVRPGKFPSYRNGYSLSYWGHGQLSFLVLAEVQPAISEIHARPEFVDWFDGSVWKQHAPDFALWTGRGLVYVDVEGEAAFRKEATQSRSSALRNRLGSRDIGYRCFRAKPFDAQPRLDRAKTINRFARSRLPEETLRLIYRAVPAEASATTRSVAAACSLEPRLCLGGLLHHVWHGRLQVDLAAELDFTSSFRRAVR